MTSSLRALALALALSGLAAPCAAQDDDEEESSEALDAPDAEAEEEAEADEEAEAEEAPPLGPENAVLADLSLGVVGIGFEHLFDRAVALHLALQFHAPWYRGEGGNYGVGAEARVFWFLAGAGYEGLYLSPGIRASYLTHEDAAGFRDGFSMSGRVSLGWGWLFDSFYLRVGAGGQYEMADLSELPGQASADFGSPNVVLDIYLGWAG